MKAITIEPKKPGTARYEEFPEPAACEGSVLVEAIAVGVCGTDVEMVEGKYGWAPPGANRLVLGHESLGRVLDPGSCVGLKKGDLVVGIVRRPDRGSMPSFFIRLQSVEGLSPSAAAAARVTPATGRFR
jgi:threonine dehydrogenase-like Zn-dependent dehydrogenase